METISTLTEDQWKSAHAIAKTLVEQDTDVNELGKTISYLRAYSAQNQPGSKFFTYLKTLVQNGNRVGHSQQTRTYYTNIEIVCKQYLQAYHQDVDSMLQVLGWAARLMRYYKTTPISEVLTSTAQSVAPPVLSERQRIKVQAAQSQTYTEGQRITAKIVNKKDSGKKVTYEILPELRLTNSEHKKFNVLKFGQVVELEIIELRDGVPKKVKLIF